MTIKTLGTALVGQILVMFVEEAEARTNHRHITLQIEQGITSSLDGHHTELQTGVPLILQPGITLHTGIKACRTLSAIFRIAGQSIVLNLFRQAGSLMPPVETAALLCILIDIQIELQLRNEQVEVAILQHWPINQSLILSCMHAPTPVAKIRRKAILLSRIHIFWVESEETAIELGRPLTSTVTTQHITEKGVVADDRVDS